jgi:Cytochrome C assembly protein
VVAIRLGLCIVNDVGAQHGFPLVRVGMHTGPAVERVGDWFGATGLPTDPVCRMAIDPWRGAGRLTYEGVSTASARLAALAPSRRIQVRTWPPVPGWSQPLTDHIRHGWAGLSRDDLAGQGGPIERTTVGTSAAWSWGWDPKETWSFIVWVLYAAYLHARATAGWRGRRAGWISAIGVAAIACNVYAVNLWLAGLHSYAT